MQNIPHRLIPVAYTALIILSVSCSGKKDMDIDTGQDDFASILVPQSRIPLYADLTEHNLNQQAPSTRATEKTVALKDLLDTKGTVTKQHGGTTFKQVPFLQNKEDIYVILHDEKLDIDTNNASPVKKYYVETTSGGKKSSYVVTLMPQRQYADNHPDLDFLNKPNYTGYALFSKPDGTLFYAYQYHSGKADKVLVPKRNDISKVEGRNLSYFSLMIKNETRTPGLLAWLTDIGAGLYGGTINPSVCTDNFQYGNGAGGTGPGGNNANPANGTGAGNGPALETDIEWLLPDWPEDPPETALFTLSVSSNVPTHVVIMGSGEYEDGSYVAITSYYVDEEQDWNFVRWTGNFDESTVISEGDTADMLIRMDRDMEGTALYANRENKIPCWSEKDGHFSPLTTMNVRRTNQYTKYASGLYGKGIRKQIVKDGNGKPVYENGKIKTVPKNHDGIDLLAPVGTPVYAVCDGVIAKAIGSFTNTKVSRSYGNEIWIEATVNRTGLYFQYAHLNAGNAIAVNPRTGKPFAKGDTVYAGELIGYTGQTGNAYGEPNPHLHFGAKIAATGKWIDPMPYINAVKESDFETSGGALKAKSCINGQLFEDGEELIDESSESEEAE